jgi:arabinofuranosyltransferase
MVLAAMVAFAIHADAWRFLCDDAFISFRYAANLAEHGELAFNVDPLERVEGYTNFAWVIVLAALAKLGVAPEHAAPLLTWTAALAGTGLAIALCRRLRGAAEIEPVDAIPAALLAATPLWMVWSSSGLETAMAAAATLGAMLAWTAGRLRAAALATALAGLTRSDALLPIAVFGVGWLGVHALPRLRADARATLRAVPWRRVAVAALCCAVPLVAHALWRRAYYGSWLPNTWAVKQHGAALRGDWGVAYVESWARALHLAYLAPAVLLLRARHVPLALAGASVVAYAWWVGGDFMAYSRFCAVATATVAVLVGWLLADAKTWVASARPDARAHAGAAAVAIGLALASGLAVDARARLAADRAKPSGWIDGRWEGVTAMAGFAAVGLTVGRWMREHLPEGTLVSVGAAGAVPYASRLPTLDAYGLADPIIAHHPDVRPAIGERARPGHQLFAPASYVRERDPDLVCHVGWRGTRRPRESDAHASFRGGYAWACIETGPVLDPVEPSRAIDPAIYCCRRPRARTVGPFGTAEEP